MADRFLLTLAQLNPTMGDLAGNADKLRRAWQQGRAAGADLVALPELFLTGYNGQDLNRKPVFYRAAMDLIETLAQECAEGPALAIGAPLFAHGSLFNAYYICQEGRVRFWRCKRHLPNDTVFDELRVFAAGPLAEPCAIKNLRVGFPICEDAWFPDVAQSLAKAGADVLVVPNGSPYDRTKYDLRLRHMEARLHETGLPLMYLNMVGGQDDQVFDGGSFVLNPGGEVALQLPRFDEAIAHVSLENTGTGWRARHGVKAALPVGAEADYRACVEGLRDYVGKSGFTKALLGLSGGIDSALVAAIAVDALGAAAVRAVMLPSSYTSEQSLEDAAAVAQRLGCRYQRLAITQAQRAVLDTLAPLFGDMPPDTTEENIQSRLRGVLLMALSNKFGEMLLSTGNKSESAVGYATLYGDMCGGYNPIKDLYKTAVVRLCHWRNAHHCPWMRGPAGPVIAESVIRKPPSAELRPNQTDQDSLPAYETLDAILHLLVEEDKSVADCAAAGHDRKTIRRIEQLLYGGEFKRFQSAPGVRLSDRAFWLDRRYPIVNRFRDPS